jgi:SAM-dependent methyltransferase
MVPMKASNFDLVAAPYRWLEYASFGPYLQRCRRKQLAHLGNKQRALLLGDGDGRFLARLLKANPELTADVVDSSRSMLRVLEQRIWRMGDQARQRIRLHHADVLSWTPTGSYDLVVSHFFLDCFFPRQLEHLFDRLAPHLDRPAHWVVSEFCILREAPGSYLSACLVGLLYRSFGLLTGLTVRDLPDHAALLRSRGLGLARQDTFLGGLLQSQLWSFPG